jgi:hypothetical protein
MNTSPDNTPSNSGSDPVNPNGLQAFTTLGEFLDLDNWHPQQVEGKYIYRTYFSGKNGDFRCFAQVMVNLEQFLFYTTAPVRVPEEDRLAVAEFITRANYGIRIGNFELDYSDGEVRFKTSIDFEGEPLTHNFIRHTIYPAVLTMDHYITGLMSVVYGAMTPFEAIESVEGSRQREQED